jgi:hypothetical protein
MPTRLGSAFLWLSTVIAAAWIWFNGYAGEQNITFAVGVAVAVVGVGAGIRYIIGSAQG